MNTPTMNERILDEISGMECVYCESPYVKREDEIAAANAIEKLFIEAHIELLRGLLGEMKETNEVYMEKYLINLEIKKKLEQLNEMKKPEPKDYPPQSPHDLEWGGIGQKYYSDIEIWEREQKELERLKKDTLDLLDEAQRLNSADWNKYPYKDTQPIHTSLDEAAKEYAINEGYAPVSVSIKELQKAFTAGATWQAKQQVVIDPEFCEYIDEARNELTLFINAYEWRTDLRTNIENILIAYDQLFSRYKSALKTK